MSYNAPFGSENHPCCPWHGNTGVSDLPMQDKCDECFQYYDDDNCEAFEIEASGKVIKIILCNECIEAIEESEGIEEYIEGIKHSLSNSSDLCRIARTK